MNKGLMSSLSPHYNTPQTLYDELDKEFQFNDDPCPIGNQIDGLLRAWGSRTYCNPPYGRHIGKWMMKAYAESQQGKTVVCLIPSRTDTRWWHDYVMKADEIRFIKGRLVFPPLKNNAPFPSSIVIFKRSKI